MGSVIPAGFGQATINMEFTTGPSNPMAIVIGYSNANDQSPVQNAGIIVDEYGSNVFSGGAISNNVVCTGINVVQNPGGATAELGRLFSGSKGEPSLPPQVSYLIRKLSVVGGRGGRGRIYQPGPTTAHVEEGGQLNGEGLGLLNVGFAGWLTNLDSNSIPMHILHSVPGPAPVEVTALIADALVATQRRRLRQ